MHHGKMTAHMYNIWSLAYRTHSLIFVRHCYDLVCVEFIYNGPSYVFCLIVSYYFYLSKSSVRSSGLNVAIETGTIEGIQSGYREDTVGYRRGTVVVVVVVVVVTMI